MQVASDTVNGETIAVINTGAIIHILNIDDKSGILAVMEHPEPMIGLAHANAAASPVPSGPSEASAVPDKSRALMRSNSPTANRRTP